MGHFLYTCICMYFVNRNFLLYGGNLHFHPEILLPKNVDLGEEKNSGMGVKCTKSCIWEVSKHCVEIMKKS